MDKRQEEEETSSGEDNTSNSGGSRRNIFVQNGVPVLFYIHKSVRGRGSIEADIERHGGRLTDQKRKAHIILVDPPIDLEEQRYVYYLDRRNHSTYIERSNFVRTCLKGGKYEHKKPTKRGMPGRPAGMGRVRQAFTAEEDEQLCRYIAMSVPDKEAGGRLGNFIYDRLIQFGETQRKYRWVNRHTSASWRERYKNNQDIFDDIIEEHVKADKRLRNKHVEYILDRRVGNKNLMVRMKNKLEGRRRRARRRRDDEDEDDLFDFGSEDEQDHDDSDYDRDRRPLSEAKKRQLGHEAGELSGDDPGPSIQRQRQKKKRRVDGVERVRHISDAEMDTSDAREESDNDHQREDDEDGRNGDRYQFQEDDIAMNYHASPQHDLQRDVDFDAPGPSGTQRTLVNSPTQRPVRKPVPRRVMPQPQAGSSQSAPAARPRLQQESPPHAALSQIASSSQMTLVPSTQAAAANEDQHQLQSSDQEEDDEEVSAHLLDGRQSPSPQQSREANNEATRHDTDLHEDEAQTTVTRDAPYHHTRARSRSVDVEPRIVSVEPARVTRSGRGYANYSEPAHGSVGPGRAKEAGRGREKRKATASDLVPVLEERESESEVEHQAVDVMLEESGENTLPEDTAGGPSSHGSLFSGSFESGDEDEQGDDQEKGEDGDDEGGSDAPSESDDLETEVQLRRGSRSQVQLTETKSEIIKDSHIDGRDEISNSDDSNDSLDSGDSDHDHSVLSRSGFKAASKASHTGGTSARTIATPGSVGSPFTDTGLHSSGIGHQSRAHVSRRIDTSFPSPGTRAREIKERHEREAKMQPYKPPAGSRAARTRKILN